MPRLQVLPGLPHVHHMACDDPAGRGGRHMATRLREAAAARPGNDTVPVRLAVSGGSLAPDVFAALSRGLSASEHAPLHVTVADERVVPLTADERALLAHLDAPVLTADAWHAARALPDTHNLGGFARGFTTPPARVFPLQCTPGDTAARAAAWPGFAGGPLDVVFLGFGPDGHIASLFTAAHFGPHTPALRDAPGPLVAIADSPKPPATRVSLSAGVLVAARHVVVIAAGAGKHAAYTDALAFARTTPAALQDAPNALGALLAARSRAERSTDLFIDYSLCDPNGGM